MSKLAAAQAIGALNAKAYVDGLKALDAQSVGMQTTNGISLTKMVDSAALQGNRNARSQFVVQGYLQQQVDRQNISPATSSPLAGVSDALHELIRKANDLNFAFNDLTKNAIAGLNNQLLNLITESGTSFGSLGAGAWPGMWLALALNKVESGGISSLLNSLHIPGFASGGTLGPNTLAVVGERGPELFMSGSGGTIIPNAQLGGSHSGDVHIHMDNRGVNDPAALHAAVISGVQIAVPAAMRAMNDQRQRRPSSRKLLTWSTWEY